MERRGALCLIVPHAYIKEWPSVNADLALVYNDSKVLQRIIVAMFEIFVAAKNVTADIELP